MGRVEREALVNTEPVEERQAGALQVDDRLAFAYGSAVGRWGFELSPVRVEAGGRVTSSAGWVWGQVVGISEGLWRSFPVAIDRRTVWVRCAFDDQSSIVTGIPYEVRVVTRRSAS